MNDKPLGQRIRAFFEQLITSRHVRFLEAELIRVRCEKDAEIRRLLEDKISLNAKVEKLELALMPRAFQPKTTQVMPEIVSEPRSYQEALLQHNRAQEQESAKEN